MHSIQAKELSEERMHGWGKPHSRWDANNMHLEGRGSSASSSSGIRQAHQWEQGKEPTAAKMSSLPPVNSEMRQGNPQH